MPEKFIDWGGWKGHEFRVGLYFTIYKSTDNKNVLIINSYIGHFYSWIKFAMRL